MLTRRISVHPWPTIAYPERGENELEQDAVLTRAQGKSIYSTAIIRSHLVQRLIICRDAVIAYRMLSKDVADLTPQKKKWELTQQAFDKLMDWLDADRTLAGKKYQEIRLALVKFFEFRRCLEPEHYADETIDRVARRINEGVEIQTPNPFLYFYGVALRVLQEYQRKQARTPLPPPAPDDAAITEIRLECMDRCLADLPAETRHMLAEYCQGEKRARTENRTRMAEALNISLNTLRIRVHRIREQLEKCLSDCMKESDRW